MNVSDTRRPCPSTAPEARFDHERLDAWRIAEELDQLVVAVVARVPRGRGSLAAQLDEASASVVLNLAEAMGRWGADRARTLRIARGSLLEVDAAVGALERRGACDPGTRARGHTLAVRLAAMLTGLVAAAEHAGA